MTKWFNLSFSLGKVLLIWKRANIAPVFKANAENKAENKCEERIAHRAIYTYVSPFLSDSSMAS